MPKRLQVHLTDSAKGDFADIIAWTRENFGLKQARRYASTLQATLDELTKSMLPVGARKRDDIAVGVCILHMARRRRRGRHLLVYEQRDDQDILVLRILHDSMDITRHLPSNDE